MRLFSTVLTKVRLISCISLALIYAIPSQAESLLEEQVFSKNDAVLVVGPEEKVLLEWQSDKQLVPASLTKLAMAYLVIEEWGLNHRFKTDFYVLNDQLWVQGKGDPFIVSEELEIIAAKLLELLPNRITSINLDVDYFADEAVPGRSKVSDPYNAPMSAISANFNTAKVRYNGLSWETAEPQTPITATVRKILDIEPKVRGRALRVNLINRTNAQAHFAELLLSKLRTVASASGKGFDHDISVSVNQSLPRGATLVYQHLNTRTLSDVLTGALEFSNNFIANQLFVLLSKQSNSSAMSFSQAVVYADSMLRSGMQWTDFRIEDGSGLSRDNRMSARQIDNLLEKLKPQARLFKHYPIKVRQNSMHVPIFARAKTGTLSGVHNFAGYLSVGGQMYRFVFIFNRQMPYQYRESLLTTLAQQLL